MLWGTENRTPDLQTRDNLDENLRRLVIANFDLHFFPYLVILSVQPCKDRLLPLDEQGHRIPS